MTAAMLVLEPIFEADLPPEQYAYRPRRNAQQAVVEVEELLFRGHPEVVDADLADYFGSIPHAELLKSVARRIVDRRVLHLIKMWLECPVEETDDRGRKTRTTEARDNRRGIPQGSPISPLLLERRDAEFEQKMAEVLCVYREVQVLKRAAAKSRKAIKRVAIVSYDEKPGIQAIATTAPDLPPKPGVHASFARDYEYKRHGTLSLLAGIDLLTGKVHALVRDRHRSREFIEFLKCLDAAYPASTAIKLILDNHSAHISRETTAWLDARPPGRFEFTFTPKHGSWLNLIEGFFSKFARSVLRHIRVTSKHELKERIIAGIDDVNRHPVIHTWSYKLADAA